MLNFLCHPHQEADLTVSETNHIGQIRPIHFRHFLRSPQHGHDTSRRHNRLPRP